ncbi:talin-1 isoform X1 [Pieris napi]|uniref:talin-1 isoform X1 n=2 Tax=Pieris napi TaxID=78633 RepID=UPI001FB8EA44|nr:talin-1 isoform X1 [Pieris napi]
MLRNGDMLEYNKKTRNLRVRMLDGTVKTLLVDDSQVVANLMVVICTKIGITNYDEYGLVREEQKEEADPCEKPNYGTLTLRRRHHEKERDAKMEQLRKKLRTDDEVNWVEPSKTLREQGIDVTETLLLRRKLFFSDRNVDSRDPVQLNLLYVQARDAILDGTHPITQDKACEFAGLQCQIQFGDHKEDKHTTGFLDLKEFLPASYVKVKGIEKKVFKEHKKHINLSELDAKVLYTKSARDLPTYGVAFFLVKEKMKGKNKLVPRLLGVTKDSVLRLDEKTKEILQTWPLTTVRRWCASPNTFTLDFGDYSDQYYSVQTTEAEQILQVIAGYIDIIVRKRRAKDHLGIEGDEGSAMLEDSVSPSKANIIQHDTFKSGKVNTESVAKPAVLRPGAEGAKPFAVGHMTGAQQTTISGQAITGHTPPAASQVQQTRITSILSEPQRALLSTITSGREVIKQTEERLTRAALPALGSDAGSIRWKTSTLDSSKQVVTSHIAAMNAATAQVVTLTAGPTEEVDHTAVGAAITTITTNLPEMTKGVQMIAALMEDDNGDSLLDATRKLCSAFTDLLRAAEPETKEPRQNLLNAASRVGEASTSVLHTIGEETPQDKETQDILLSLAKAVANTTAALVLKAKNVAAQCRDEQPLQNTIIAAATHCALATSQLVACAKVVAPTLHNPACREQLTSAARLVAQAVERLVGACQHAPESAGPGVEHLTLAAQRVTEELERLLAHCDLDRRGQATVIEQSVESVLTASERLGSAGEPAEMLRRARVLGQATARLIADIKTEAEKQPSESQGKLLAAAKLLADATARMVEAARQCASEPQDRDKQEALLRAAEELRFITADYAQGQDIVSSQVARLYESARQAASSANQLVASAHNATQYNTNKYSQEALLSECSILSSHIPRLSEAGSVFSARPHNPAAHLDLVTASETFLQPSGHVAQASRAVLPTVSEPAANKQLADTTNQFTASCADLRSAVSRARASCRGLELDAAAEILRDLKEELDEMERACAAFQLAPLPQQTVEWAYSNLQSSGRSAASASAALSAGAKRQDSAGCGRAALDLASSLRHFAPPLRAAIAHAHKEQQPRVLASGRQVVTSSLTLVENVKRFLNSSEEVDCANVVNMAKNVSQSVELTLESVPSHAELDSAMEDINQTLHILDMDDLPRTDKSYSELQTELNAAAVGLSTASSDVVSSVEQGTLSASGRHFGDAFNRLMGVSLELAGQTEARESRTEMIRSMKTVTVNSSKLLGTAKSVSQDLTRPNAKNQLAAAARAVTESINNLVDVCTEAAPGQKECSAAIRSIQSTRTLLSQPSQPINDMGYFACLDAVVEQSKALSEGMSGMASSIKKSDTTQFSRSVSAAGLAVQTLVECTAQSAYLTAVSDETSVAGRAGLVDQAQFARAAAAIERACATLSDPRTDQHQVLSAATVIAKHTSALCNACRVASGRSAEPQSKRHFVQAAKDVANCTAALVKEIKALDLDYSEANRERCAQATSPLQEAVRSLCQFADSPEFAAVPARISPQARLSQEAILDCGRSIISGSCSMLEAARVLVLAPSDRPQWQALATHSKTVSDSIKLLVTNIREKAPGQRECARALDTLNSQQRELDQVAIQAVGQELRSRQANTLQGYCEQVENSAAEMLEKLEPVKIAATSEAENLGHSVLQMVSYAEPLVSAASGAASNLTESASQSGLLQHTRTVLETLSLLVHAAKQSGGNPRATSAHSEVEAQCSLARAALNELSGQVRELSTQRGAVGPLLDSVARAVARLTEHRMSLIGSYDETESFVDYQTRMVAAAKEIARLASDMTAKAATEPARLVELGNEMCQKYEKLASDSVGASATTPNADVANRIRVCAVEVGEGVSELVRAGGHCRLAAISQNQRSVADNARKLNEKVVSLLSALQAGSRGTQACIDAAATIATIIGDLDTTILFASAGTLQSEKEGDTFSNHRENILKTAKTLVEDTKSLVGGAGGTQEQLAAAAQSAVGTIMQLCEVVKQGAMSLGGGSAEPQVLVLHAARDAAAALRDLAAATAAASGKHVQHPDMDRLKHAAKRLSDPKRWSLPIKTNTIPKAKRRSLIKDYNSCDSETDIFQSDQEDELIKLLDYSSQDDDISPSIFHDSCEELITYIEDLMTQPISREINDDVNARYNIAAKNSLFDMDWRVLKYGEGIFLAELRKFIDVCVDVAKKADNRRKRNARQFKVVSSDLDSEMKRLSQVVEDLDWQDTVNTNLSIKITKIDKPNLKSPVFKLKKVKPVNLVVNTENKDVTSIEPSQNSPKTPESGLNTINKKQFWNMFKDDTECWKALAQRNLERMEETRLELERFSGHELVLGEIKTEIDKYEKEKHTLRSFIEEVDLSKTINKDLEYNKKYEDIVLKLIDFAKRDFNYKGFDPLISKLKALSNIEIERKQKDLDIYTKIDISKSTYEELCLLERYYNKIIRTYIPNVTNEGRNNKNIEIYDITRTYPKQYYANNWWTIYEDVIKNREKQFGSLDGWWDFYESMMNRKDMKVIVKERQRPKSRMEEQLKILDEVDNTRFRETEAVENSGNESVMVTNVTSLLKTVKAVEDEHTRGTRALESTIEAISQEIEVLMSPSPPKSTGSPEELVRCTRLMTAATARAVAAGGIAGATGQEQLTAAANLGRKTVLDMMAAAKSAAHSAESEELKQRTLEATRVAAESYRSLLSALLSAPASRHALPELSRNVAHAVADMLAAADLLKGSDWVDPADPTVIAEQELLGAAASIDAAARKLEKLRPRMQQAQETDENLNFDEMILEAAKSIIAATSALVRAASAAQRELIDQGKVARRPTSSSDDGQWSEGLVSAARLVAAAAHALVEAANALVQGAASEERLISSARQVASSTAQLLVACKVKADPTSESTRRLQAAGAEVIRSTDGLVRAARDAIHCDDERSLVLNRRMVGGIAQEIDARSEVLRIEKELEEARGRLTAIRQAKYKLRGDTSGDDTDTDGQDVQHRFKSPTSSFANTTYSPNSTYTTQNTTQNLTQNTSVTHNTTHNLSPVYSPGYNGFKDKGDKSPSFSSFRPDETPKQNYEGFTTREKSTKLNDRTMRNEISMTTKKAEVRNLIDGERITYRRERPTPPPRRVSLNYETRLYDTPRPVNEYYDKKERVENYKTENQYYKEEKYGYDTPKAPMSPKFNARELRDDNEPIYSTLRKSPLDGIGETFSEHQKSTEAIPGGTKHSEYSIKSESYQSYPKTEYIKSFATSTPTKFDFKPLDAKQGDVGKNFLEETTTEVKEIPNGTQKITTTKIYSSSPVNLTSTNTKYEPIKLDGIDELSKFEDSRYSTLDSRYNESKSDSSRFLRPSEFRADVKREMLKEIDGMDKKFSKQTITSEMVERKSVMTSSHKTESSSTVTKKFGNF